MSQTQQQQEKQEKKVYGYARMPRIIRRGFSQLSKLQKLLYIYLRDLCGEIGTCFRSLRSLALETDFSTGYLSKNIPALAKAGLIDAKKQKRFEKKWEVWHISIVDIWEKNASFLQGNCSPDEQNDEKPPEESEESVHEVNTNCSPDERNSQNCSPDERNSQNCSQGELEIRIPCNEISSLNENPLNESTPSDDAPHIAPSSSLDDKNKNNVSSPSSPPPPPTSLNVVSADGSGNKRVKKLNIKDIYAAASPEIQRLTQSVIHEWLGLFRYPIPVTDTILTHAMMLAGFAPEPEEIKNCRLWMYETDEKKWYTKRGMHLGDVAREFEKFRSLKDIPPSRGSASIAVPTAKKKDASWHARMQAMVDPGFTVLSPLQLALLPLEERKAYNAKLRQQLQQSQQPQQQ